MADAPTMSKEKSDKKEKKEKRDKHSKKEKHADKNGVSKSKKDKKDKDKKTLAVPAEGAEKLLQDIDSRERDVTILPKKIEGGAGDNGAAGGGDVMDVDEDVKMENGEDAENVEVQITPRGALVPFANPLADERTAKRVFKSVKKGEFVVFSLPHYESISLFPIVLCLQKNILSRIGYQAPSPHLPLSLLPKPSLQPLY